MLRLVVVALLVVAAYANLDSSLIDTANDEVGKERLFLYASTLTNIAVTTTTTTMTVSTYCYSIVAGAYLLSTTGTYSTLTTLQTTISTIPNCRRRRWAFEDAIDGQVVGVVDSLAESIEAAQVEKELQADPLEKESVPASIAETAVDANNPRLLNIVAKTTVTLTAIATVTSSVNTKTFAVTCTPINIVFNKC